MIELGSGLSLERDPILAAHEATTQAKKELGAGKIDLAIVFSSADLASHAVLAEAVSEYLDGTTVIGCSGAAVITNQGIFKHGLALLLLRLPRGLYFNAGPVRDIKNKTSLAAGRELGEKLLFGFKDLRRDLSIVLYDGLIGDNSNLITGVQEKLGRSFPLVGASASDNLRFLKTYLYFNNEVFSDGAVGMLWGGKCSFGLGVKHGWKPLGKPRTVTRSEGNVVYEIDGKPAFRIYEEYLAKDYSSLQKEIRNLSIFYPIGIYVEGEKEYLLRNAISVQEDGSLRFQGAVPSQSTIRLMIGTKESCLEATKQAISDAQRTLIGQSSIFGETKTRNFVLVFNSVSRYTLFKRHAIDEIESIKNGFNKDTPVIGIYTYGEQAPLKAVSYHGQTYFHNQTVTIINIGG